MRIVDMTPVQIEINRIIRNVCDGTAVSFDDILSDKRKGNESFARFILSHRLRKYGLTVEHIAAILNKNHSTVLYGLKQYDALLETCPMFKDMVAGVDLMASMSVMYDNNIPV